MPVVAATAAAATAAARLGLAAWAALVAVVTEAAAGPCLVGLLALATTMAARQVLEVTPLATEDDNRESASLANGCRV